MVKRICALALAMIMTALLAGCNKTETSVTEGDGYAQGYSEGFAAGQEAAKGTVSTVTPAVADEDGRYPFYESEKVRITLAPLREDSACQYVDFHAENLTGDEMNLEVAGIALNGYSFETAYGATLPANGTAWLSLSIYKDEINLVGNLGAISDLSAVFHLYDAEYASIADFISQVALLDGTPSIDPGAGELLYENGGISIKSMGLIDSDQGKLIKLMVENGSATTITVDAMGGAIPAEKVEPSLYRTVLPGTKAIGTMPVYTDDYVQIVDPTTVPYVSVIFRISDLVEDGDYSIVDPITFRTGGEGRFKLSSNGRELTVTETNYIYEEAEWVVKSSDENVLSLVSAETFDADDGATQLLEAKFAAGKAGSATLSLKYHPIGSDLDEGINLYPTIYQSRELYFDVNADGTIAPAQVEFYVEDYRPDEPVTYNYVLDTDGNMINKFSSLG